ncbi:MAG: DUF1826 domain-containing protein [Pseudomonadota bacterium]
MNVVPLTTKKALQGVVVTEDPTGLDAFRNADTAAAIWQRQLPEDVRAWLDRLSPDQLPTGRVIVPPHAFDEVAAHLFEMSGVPKGNEHDWLLSDVTALAAQFSDLMSPRFIRLRLDVINTNSCRKFHVDAITGRLICTYRGTGTQYGFSAYGRDPERIFTVPTGSPILLRGTLWQPKPSPGLLHRSPPIEGSGETRLLLVLDPVSRPGEDV